MGFKRLNAGRPIFAAALCALVCVPAGIAPAAEPFPFGQVLVLDAARMGPVKRVPVITIDADGGATIDLWCRTVPARLQVADAQIRIETAPLPEALPLYMSAGQCSEERMQADVAMLTALTQANAWQRRGDRVSLSGPEQTQPLSFRLSSH